MKILFVDQSEDLQSKWIEPLRKKGWGVVRARSAEDAGRMLYLHGDAVEAIVTGEKFVTWAEKQDVPFVVLTTTWNDMAVIKHQNSNHSAVAYLTYANGMEELYVLFENSEGELRATGTEGLPVQKAQAISSQLTQPIEQNKLIERSALVDRKKFSEDQELEVYSEVHNQPEPREGAAGLQLQAPNVLLGGKEASSLPQASKPASAQTQVRFEKQQNTVAIEQTVVLSPEDHTGFSLNDNADRTRLQVVRPEVEEISIVEEDEPATRIFSTIPNTSAQVITTSQVDDDDSEGATKLLHLTSIKLGQTGEAADDLGSGEPAFVPPPPNPYANAYASTPVSQFAVNPMPTASVSDLETLRSYVALREQDVAVLSGQVRSAQERIQQLELQVKIEKVKSLELTHLVSKQEQKIKNYDQEKQVELEVLDRQVEDIDQQLKDRTEKVRSIEAKLRLTLDEVAKVKDRVRVDIRRIRVREKELEGQLEVLKKDSSALLQARDDKILELKRKIDLLEFNMELVQEQFTKEKQSANELKNKLKDAAQVMRQAGGLLGQ